MLRRILAAIVLCWPVHAMADDSVSTFTLKNGLDIVVIEDNRAPVVVHMLWYRVGSADEPAGQSGVAHFLEHLMFKATDTLYSGEFSDVVAANGGTDNAFTSYDYTGYFQRVAADRLGLMMQMEADRMVNLALTEDDIITERDVVIEERNQRTENSPGALFSEQRRAAQYLNHRYGVPIIGWRQEIDRLDMDAVMAFYNRHYAPNNAILVVAGDVTPSQVLTLAQTHYGPIPAGPAILPRARPQEPPQLSERRLVFADQRVSQPVFVRTYLAPERDPGDQKTAAALVYLAELLGGAGATSLFGQALQFDSKQAVYTNAYYGALSLDDTTFGIVGVPTPDVTLEELEAAMDGVIAQFMEDGVDVDSFTRIKSQLRASEIYALDSTSARARRYGAALTSGLRVEDVQAWPRVLQSVTPQDVLDAAMLVFNDKHSVTGWLVPQQAEGEADQ